MKKTFALKSREGLRFLLVFVLELLHTAGGVHKHFLASEKRMRSRTNFDFDHGVFLSIRPFHRFLRDRGRTAQKLKIARSIPKDHFFILRVDALFHIILLKGLQK